MNFAFSREVNQQGQSKQTIPGSRPVVFLNEKGSDLDGFSLILILNVLLTYELPYEKTSLHVFRVSDQVLHKPGCTASGVGKRLKY